MRVLLVADFYPPVVGGIEQHVQHLARSLVARGHRVAVASIAPPGIHPGVEVDQGVAVHRLPSTLRRLPGAYSAAGRPLAPPAPDPELTIALGGVVRSFRPEIVHGHSWSVCSYLPLHPASGAGLVVTLHDHGLVCAKKSLVYQGELCSGPAPRKCAGCVSSHYGPVRGLPTLAALALTSPLVRRAADRLIAVSGAVAQASGVGDRAAVIPNFLPELPARSGTAEDLASWAAQLPRGPFLLFVGALGGHKGLPDLIAAWRQLEAAPPLVCIGHRWSDTPAEVPAGVLLYEDWPNEAVRVAWRSCVFGFIPSTWPEPFR